MRDLGHPIFVSSGPPDSPTGRLPPSDPADQVHIDVIDAVTGKYIEGAEGGVNFRKATADARATLRGARTYIFMAASNSTPGMRTSSS